MEAIFGIGIKGKGNGSEAHHAFSDSHDVGRFIRKETGEVKAVWISRGRGGIVIVECETTEQRDGVLKIRAFGGADVIAYVFPMRKKPTVK